MGKDRLGIGIIGSGFNARFHLQAFVGVRDADVKGIWSPNEKNAEEAAKLAYSPQPILWTHLTTILRDQLRAANSSRKRSVWRPAALCLRRFR